MVNNIKNYFILLLPIFVFQIGFKSFAQVILNSDFELNSGQVGTDYLDLDHLSFDTLVLNCSSYGTGSYGGIDLISTNNWDGVAYSGNWYLGIEGGNVEQFSMELDTLLISGVTYRIIYYDRGRAQHPPAPIKIGISSTSDSFGTLVYSGTEPEVGKWNKRCFTFIAPFGGQYITVRASSAMGSWSKLDNFVIDQDTLKPCMVTLILNVPNVFTPNKDDKNDNFLITIEGVKKIKGVVVNRWGNTIHEYSSETITSPATIDFWDGYTQTGKLVSDGVYFYVIELTDMKNEIKVLNGTINVFK
ncbi:MAG: gliding motility-associated C-terminal domain-containing protein [Crocinitomicaceae bacterium]